ncbi:S41 family peptidase [uncultured Bacteroides sp.]|uniref:S41 family peptidase n=1 Tax=uncultured Bacteroides sp. TaxID=162156 RepID=UPI002AA852A6|nr:S41 family peptidase [uncultured Bacteroides sp.]
MMVQNKYRVKNGNLRATRRLIELVLGVLLLCTVSSCIREDEYDNTPQGNFDALWKIIDERYCFLEYKQINWDSIHTVYQQRITNDMSDDNLFEVLGDMLTELKDGHVNLYSASDVARYWNWYEDYPRNFNESIIENYLGTNYHIAGGAKYKILNDNVGYIYYESFSNTIGNGNLDEILQNMSICNGLIIDVRNNGGGNLSNSTSLASRFTNERVLTGYIRHKTGKGHNDFSDPIAINLDPSNSIRWQKKVIVLTNRHAYSATNDFVNSMRYLPQVTILGDRTGGGSGLPFTSELPNGWSVRYSSSPHFDAEMNQIEFGIDPDIKIDMQGGDEEKGVDTMIEKARALLKN